MDWQVNTYVWGRAVATTENLDPGKKRINRIYYIHSGEAYLELDEGYILDVLNFLQQVLLFLLGFCQHKFFLSFCYL